MNINILTDEVQQYINKHIDADVNKIALAKTSFVSISSAELAGQIAAKKKSKFKLPSWFNIPKIYFPPLLSIEQTSSEVTASYKSQLVQGVSLIDLTAGFGVDSYYFSRKIAKVYSCEINEELAAIAKYNACILGADNIEVLTVDGTELLKSTSETYDTIYVDPARRNQSNKVFKLVDCSPNIIPLLDLLLAKASIVMIKTSPLLDLSAGLRELKNVVDIHILSVKNECKELLWVLTKHTHRDPIIHCVTLNERTKQFDFSMADLQVSAMIASEEPSGYLYEPDVALLKSGAFNLIAQRFGLQKLHPQSQLYFCAQVKSEFLGRIFKIDDLLSLNELKKEKSLRGNVIVRNFPDKAENLVKKFKITPTHDDFIIFTRTNRGHVAIRSKIIQHY